MAFIRNSLRGLENMIRASHKCHPISMQIRCMSYQQQFEEAKKKLDTLSQDPGNEAKLKIYGLFKQSTVGAVNSKRPGVTNFVGRAKWDAWNTFKDMDKETAQKSYIDLIDSLAGKDEKEVEIEDSTQYKNLMVDTKGGLRTITFNRPKKMNAFTFEMYQEIEDALKEAENDPKTVITALTGAGPYFCSGNDLSNFMVSADKYEEVAEYTKVNLKRFVGAFVDFPKPLIAAVNGPAVGIGVTILALCDVVYSSDKATFLTPFSSLGQTPEGCSTLLFPRLMGYGKTSEILFFNKKITAVEACRNNLVTEVFPDHAFQDEVGRRLEAYSKLPIKSLVYSKKLVRDTDLKELHKINELEWDRLRERILSDDAMEAVKRFFTKKNKK